MGLLSKLRFFAIDKSPEIHFVAGTVMMVATAVSAAKRSLSFQEILKERKEILEEFAELEKEKKEQGKSYPEKELKKNRRKLTLAVIWRTIVNWAPTFLLGFASVFLYGRGFGIMKGRYVTAAGICATLATENEQLREIISKGKAKEAEAGEDIVYDKEDAGEAPSSEIDDVSKYDRYFGPNHPCWDKDKARRRNWIRQKEEWLNFLLDQHEYLFANDAWKIMKFKGEDAGQVLGYKKYKDHPEVAEKFGGNNRVVLDIIDDPNSEGCYIRFNFDKKPITGRIDCYA